MTIAIIQDQLTPDDIRALSRICFPVLQNHEPTTLREHLGIDAALSDIEATALIVAALVERARHLPPPVLAEINRLLAASSKESIRAFFAETAGQYGDPTETKPLTDIFPEGQFTRPRPAPDELDRVPIVRETVAQTLGPEGAIATHMGRYEHRGGQIDMATSVCDAFNQSKCLLVEAGTGIGKSLAYLVPAIMRATANKIPVVISTNTKNLQSQLFEKDLPLLSEALGIDFKAALIKGRMNYLCVRKLLYLLEEVEQELDLDDHDQGTILHVLGWAAGTITGDFAESSILEQPSQRELRTRLASSAEECPGRNCPHVRRCFLRKARARSHAADVIVANHSLVFAESNLTASALPPYVDIVFDEAHNIEEAATRHFSVELSTAKLRFITRRLLSKRGRRGRAKGFLPSMLTHLDTSSFHGTATQREKAQQLTESMIAQVEALQTSSAHLFEALVDLLERPSNNTLRVTAAVKGSAIWRSVEEAGSGMADELLSLSHSADALAELLREVDADELPFHQNHIVELGALSTRLTELLTDLQFVIAAKEAGYVFWVERYGTRRDGARAWGAPISVGPKLAEAFYAQKETVVLASATLTVRGTFDFFRSRLGLDAVDPERCMELNAGSPFDYDQQCRVLVPMFLPEPGEAGGQYGAELGALLAEVFRRTHGRGMVLFTSYRMLRETTEALEQDLQHDTIPVLSQGQSGSRENITSLFKRNMEAVLMGTHSFWEGVDVVGETLSCLVIARLPFAVYTDPIQVARCEAIAEQGGDPFRSYSLPNAVIRFRQGFGRLIRHRTDRGVVIVTDRRIMTKSYGAAFRKSLPARTISLSDREPFLDAIQDCLSDP